MAEHTWTIVELHLELERWRRELVAAGKSEHTVSTYIGRSEMFLRWLTGEYGSR